MESSTTHKPQTQEELLQLRDKQEQTLLDYYRKKQDIFYNVK